MFYPEVVVTPRLQAKHRSRSLRRISVFSSPRLRGEGQGEGKRGREGGHFVGFEPTENGCSR
jgi:hypothetical protein